MLLELKKDLIFCFLVPAHLTLLPGHWGSRMQPVGTPSFWSRDSHLTGCNPDHAADPWCDLTRVLYPVQAGARYKYEGLGLTGDRKEGCTGN